MSDQNEEPNQLQPNVDQIGDGLIQKKEVTSYMHDAKSNNSGNYNEFTTPKLGNSQSKQGSKQSSKDRNSHDQIMQVVEN